MTAWVRESVAAFGASCKAKLAGPGDREAAIRSPIEALLAAAGAGIGVSAVPFDEVRDVARAVRPDYAIAVNGAITGYVEVKRPGVSVAPATFTGHNLRQWERQRDLPNLIYTNGTEWRLWRDGEPEAGPVYLSGGTLEKAGERLAAPDGFESLLVDFLRWRPTPITSVGALVRAVAPLTRLLRAEVLEQLSLERVAVAAGAAEEEQSFSGLARDWRAMLFPAATDAVFADGYAQAVTFALLLARTEDIALDRPLHEIGTKLGAAAHTLMGRALQLLTDNVAADFKVTLDLLVRVIGAVNWSRIRAGRSDAYLHLYEHFLDVYDPELRKQSGSYYTPREIVEQMTRLAEEALQEHLARPTGFADKTVTTVDPAMGTGTYLHTIIDRVATAIAEREGAGAVPATVTDLARRLIGFELQMGPYAVAELRTSDLMRELKAKIPTGGMRLYVTDTLDDPHAEITQLGSGMELIAQSRRHANTVKATTKVTVVIGNPPYRERADGLGGWVENGAPLQQTPLDAFRDPTTARHFHNLKNLYVYFWRWATWKVFESTAAAGPDGDAGVICFISTSGYVRGPGFTAMRRYLRQYATHGWIIDLTPEGQTPEIPTRIFPGVRQPLAIGLFVRQPGTELTEPAEVFYQAVHGLQEDKFNALSRLTLGDGAWRLARTGWTDPFTPAAESSWDAYPALSDLMPWTSPGVTGNRRWPYAPSEEILRARWRRLLTESDPGTKAVLLKETGDRSLDGEQMPLPGADTAESSRPLARERSRDPAIVPVGFRALDRQYVIADSRVLDRPRPALWSARIPGQLFVIEQHSQAITDGPGVVFSHLIPDLHHFDNRGGRALPLFNPGGRPNLAPGLLTALSTLVGGELFTAEVTASDLLAYIAAVVAHPAFTTTFRDELTTPGIRVPLTADPALWAEAVQIGKSIVWTYTYGNIFTDTPAGRPSGTVRIPATDERRILNRQAVTGMPTQLVYDEATREVALGTGVWGPVSQEVYDYTVGGKNVIKSWFNYRKAEPGGKKTSPLDDMHMDSWPSEWSVEFTDLLSVLTRLVAAEPEQARILSRILAGPLLTGDLLARHGVRLPQESADHKPDYRSAAAAATDDEDQTLAFDGPSV